MFFKKQAFKIKDLLKEKGVDLPLVSVQEILAKSYGFNNRHVILSDLEFNTSLDKLNVKLTQPPQHADTPLTELPEIISRENIVNYRFWWNYDSDHPIHYPTTGPGSPFDEDYLDLDSKEPELDFWVWEHGKDDMIRSTKIQYSYNKEADHFERNDIVVKKLSSSTNGDRSSINFSKLPEKITLENSKNHSFYWKNDKSDEVYSFPALSPFNFGMDFTICRDNKAPTFLSYRYNKETNHFEKENVLKVYLKRKGEKTFFKNFKDVKISSKDMVELLESATSWLEEIKRILNHKSCPVSVLEAYAKHELFFVRIVAIFSKTHRSKLVGLAKADSDVRVRGLYYKYLINDTETPIEEIRALLKKETTAAINMVRHYTVDGEPIVNW